MRAVAGGGCRLALRDDGTVAAGLLREQPSRTVPALGTAIERVRGQVVLLSESADGPAPALLPFASSAKELFEVAQREAHWLEHGRIDT